MSIWDSDKAPLNMPLPTLGGKAFWEDVEECKGYRLQQHKLTKHCRILNKWNVRVAWGQEGPMIAELMKLSMPGTSPRARYGDVIGVHRAGGLYDHYGVYENDDCVYEYGENGNGKINIHITTLAKFTNHTGSYFVLVFPRNYGIPGKIEVGPRPFDISLGQSDGMLKTYVKSVDAYKNPKEYTMYPPNATIRRAKSRLGEEKYNLLFNNCEHFAIWCKTGLKDSHQIDSIITFSSPIK